MSKKLEVLSSVIYNMFSYDNFPQLDMDDMEVMWKALIEKWEIKISDEKYKEFIEEVNCPAADKYSWFINCFKKYFDEI